MSITINKGGSGGSMDYTDAQFTAGATNTVGLSVKKIASQTANLFGIYDESNNDLLYVESDGDLILKQGLSLDGTTKAFRLPRLTTAQRAALTPAEGMKVYDTDIDAEMVYSDEWELVQGLSKPYYYTQMLDHFMGAAIASTLGWGASVTGTSSAGGIGTDTKDATAHGVAILNAGTDTNSRAAISLTSSDMHYGNSCKIIWEYRIWINQLANATDDYYINIGNQDTNTNLDSANGVYLQYNRSVSTAWQLVSRDNSNETRVVTSKTVEAAKWNILRVEVNAAANSADFYYDGVYVSTHALTYCPTTYTRYSHPKARINNTAGTGIGRIFQVDWFMMEIIRL